MTLGVTYYAYPASAKATYKDSLAQTKPGNSGDIFSASNSQNSSEDLKSKLKEAQDKQGFLGKFWNGVKKITGLGLSSNKVEEKIKQYENGQISYEEAQESINSFEQKQNSMTDMLSSVASGLVVTGATIFTGGVGLLASAAIGGASKVALKTADRATNNVKNDEIDLKQMGKDAMTGAVEGVITTATVGAANAAKTVAKQSIKSGIKQGAIQGAKCGALAGGAMGVTNYTADAVFEEDVDFSLNKALKTGAQGALVGGVLGGVMGGVTGGIRQAKLNKSFDEISQSSEQLTKKYKSGIDSVEKEYKEHFGELESVEKVTARSKSQDSVEKKLISKFEKGKLTSFDTDSCAEAIGDGYGARVQVKSLTPEQARSIVDESLAGTGKTYDDLVLAIKSKGALSEEYIAAIDKLKEAQTGEFFDTLCSKIKSGEINLADEFNNYGDEITSYFSNEQLRKIGLVYKETTGLEPTFINKTSVAKETVFPKIGDSKQFFKTDIEKATKASGYPTAQANAISTKTNGLPVADTEFQLRGVKVNEYADVEHILYDIRQGKIEATDPKYADIFKTIKGLSSESYDELTNYSADVYRSLRLQELGIPTNIPKSPSILTYADKDALIKAGLGDITSKAGQQLTEQELQTLVNRRLLNFQIK